VDLVDLLRYASTAMLSDTVHNCIVLYLPYDIHDTPALFPRVEKDYFIH